jgi:plasmid stability protein
MTVTLNLPPDKEAALKAQARAHGLSVEEWLLELADLAVQGSEAAIQFGNLSDLLLNSPFSGANLDLERSQDDTRPVDLK